MIRFEKVSKSFGEKHVLRELSFAVNTGEILFILGKSGMGKSVTLKTLVGLLKPDAGSIYVGETLVNAPAQDQAELARIRKRCGMIFQHPALLDSLTIFENVAFGLDEMSFEEKRERTFECLGLVHLSKEILDLKPQDISYGMQKRVSLARTLAPSPEVLLFDEPTTGLDPITTTAINDLIFELSRKLRVTSLVVSHDMGCALKIADRILVLDQGKILALQSPQEMKNNQDPLIVDFLSEVI